jgi:low temperature requirement protein LtrA
MGIFSDRLSQLWQPPNLRTTEKGRHATWLELFYDLVFVVAVAQLGLLLSRQLTVSRLLEFIFLFIPIWYAWFHHTLYADRFDTDNFAHRFLTIVQMLGMAGVAANVTGALGETSQVFAASIVIVKLVMVLLYRRCYHIEIARPLAIRLSNVFLISGFLWLLSIFVPIPWRFWIWGLAIIFEFAVVFHHSTRMKYAVMPVSESHVVERFGLFTILVLGEAVAGIVNGAAEAKFQIVTAAVSVFGVLLVFGYWWIYFENLDGSALKGLGGVVSSNMVVYPFTIGNQFDCSGSGYRAIDRRGHNPFGKFGHLVDIRCTGSILCRDWGDPYRGFEIQTRNAQSSKRVMEVYCRGFGDPDRGICLCHRWISSTFDWTAIACVARTGDRRTLRTH